VTRSEEGLLGSEADRTVTISAAARPESEVPRHAEVARGHLATSPRKCTRCWAPDADCL